MSGSHISRSASAVALACLIGTTSSAPAEPREARSLPKFPPDSTLSGLKLPSYDENRQLQSVLTVGELQVEDVNNYVASKINIRLFDPTGKQTSHLSLETAKINRLTSVLHSDHPLNFNDSRGSLRSKGVFFDLQTKQTFFLGPGDLELNLTTMKQQPNTSRIAPRLRSTLATVAVGSATLSSGLAAPLPGDVTPEFLAEFAEISKSWASRYADEATASQALIESTATDVERIDTALEAFAANAEITIQAAADDAKAAEPDFKELAKDHRINAEFEGGMYVDPEELALVLVEDIVFTDKLNRVTLKCAGEVKVFFSEQEPEKEDDADAEQSPFSRMGELKSVVATGGIDLTRVLDDGKIFRLTGATVHYDAVSEEIVVSGGRPTMTHPDGYMRARNNDQRIIVKKSGKYTAPGPWDIAATPPKN